MTRCKDCSHDADAGARCARCAKAHRRREAERRAAHKAAGACVVCGERAARVNGQTLTTCPVHREYYRARRAGG